MTPPRMAPALAARVVWPRVVELVRFLEANGFELAALALETTHPSGVGGRIVARELRQLLGELAAESVRLEYPSISHILQESAP